MTSTTTSEQLHAIGLSVSLTVKDLQESLRWYHEIVGFHYERPLEYNGVVRGALVTAGNVRILLNQDDGAKGWERTKGEGFSMSIVTEQDVDAIAAGILARGGSLESPPSDMPWGARAMRLRDPDGYRIAIQKMLR